MLWPKKHGGSLGFQCIVANICGGDAACVSWDRRENLGVFPPFPIMEEVLITETGDAIIAKGSEIWGGMVERIAKSIIDAKEVAVSDVTLGNDVPVCNLCKSGLAPTDA